MVIQTARKATGGYCPRRYPAAPALPPSEPTLRPGPKNLLNTTKSNPQTAEIEHANSQNSPLFRLPSEIRNRIYECVVGVGVLHIGNIFQRITDRRVLPKTICRAKEHESDAIKAIREAGESEDNANLFATRHAACLLSNNWSGFHKLLNLLLVSRQIHREAALLPYQLNTFYFSSVDHLVSLKGVLVPEQRKAIQSLGFLVKSMRDWRWNGQKLLQSMSGVREVHVAIQPSHPNFFGTPWVNIQPWLDEKTLGFWLFNEIDKAKLDLQTVFVTICPPNDGLYTAAEIAQLKMWSTRVENKLLKVNEDKGAKERPRKKRKVDWVGSLSKRSL